FFGLLWLIAAAFAPPAAAEDALSRILKAGVVKVAVPDNSPPFGEMGAGAKPEGYDIDTAMLVAAALGVKPHLVPIASADRIPALTSNEVDLVVSTLGRNPEREQHIDFSIAYAPFFGAVFGPARSPVTKPEDLAGKTVAVTQNSIEDTTL